MTSGRGCGGESRGLQIEAAAETFASHLAVALRCSGGCRYKESEREGKRERERGTERGKKREDESVRVSSLGSLALSFLGCLPDCPTAATPLPPAVCSASASASLSAAVRRGAPCLVLLPLSLSSSSPGQVALASFPRLSAFLSSRRHAGHPSVRCCSEAHFSTPSMPSVRLRWATGLPRSHRLSLTPDPTHHGNAHRPDGAG